VQNSHIATVLSLGTTSVQNAVKGARLVRRFGEEGSANAEVVAMLKYAPADEALKGATALLKYLEEVDKTSM
jgi:hypothetical protein